MWLQFDEDVDRILEITSKGNADQKLQTMCTLIMSIGSERFGTFEERGASNPVRPNRRELKISQLRQELKSLKRQYKLAEEDEKTALSELTEIIRKRLIILRRVERHRRKCKERTQKCSACIVDPFGFTKRLLGQKRSGCLTCSMQEVNHYLSSTFSDILREQELDHCEALVEPPEQLIQFNISEATLK